MKKILLTLILFTCFTLQGCSLNHSEVIYHEMKSSIYNESQLKEIAKDAVSAYEKNYTVLEISYLGDENSKKLGKEYGNAQAYLLFEIVTKQKKELISYHCLVEHTDGEWKLNPYAQGPVQAGLDLDKL